MSIERANRLIAASAPATVALVLLVLALSIQSAHAQGGDEIYVHKQLGRSDPTVHVGEYLTFTIEIRNDAAFTITTLPLSDTYNAAVLGYRDAAPPPDGAGAGWLFWNDLTTTFGDLAPGQQIVVVVGFIAEHPQQAVVNYAEVRDAEGSAGMLGGATGVSTDTESVGGSSPVDKELLINPGSTLLLPQVGMPLTFTVVITNDGYTTMTVAPLVDVYNPAWLAFNYAAPPPDHVDEVNGVLAWDDVISSRGTGPVPPHGKISVTTVFTALAALDGASANSAEVSGASDWYGNDLAGGSDDVPITIIEGPTPAPAPTPMPTATPASTPSATPRQPAPTPVIATATPELTAQATPAFLPESGRASGTQHGVLVAVLLAAVVMASALHRSLRDNNSCAGS